MAKENISRVSTSLPRLFVEANVEKEFQNEEIIPQSKPSPLVHFLSNGILDSFLLL
jgi:hypothetical protein